MGESPVSGPPIFVALSCSLYFLFLFSYSLCFYNFYYTFSSPFASQLSFDKKKKINIKRSPWCKGTYTRLSRPKMKLSLAEVKTFHRIRTLMLQRSPYFIGNVICWANTFVFVFFFPLSEIKQFQRLQALKLRMEEKKYVIGILLLTLTLSQSQRIFYSSPGDCFSKPQEQSVQKTLLWTSLLI